MNLDLMMNCDIIQPKLRPVSRPVVNCAIGSYSQPEIEAAIAAVQLTDHLAVSSILSIPTDFDQVFEPYFQYPSLLAKGNNFLKTYS